MNQNYICMSPLKPKLGAIPGLEMPYTKHEICKNYPHILS